MRNKKRQAKPKIERKMFIIFLALKHEIKRNPCSLVKSLNRLLVRHWSSEVEIHNEMFRSILLFDKSLKLALCHPLG